MLTTLVGAQSASASGDPLAALRMGPVPSVPYGIGERLYGYGTVAIPTAFQGSSDDAFTYVAAARGVVWSGSAYSATDCGAILNVWLKGTKPVAVGGVDDTGLCRPVAATLSGLGITRDNVRAYTSSGKLYATYPRTAADTGGCGSTTQVDDPYAVGYRVLVKEINCNAGLQGTYLWYPGSGKQQLPNTYAVVGRLGPGWLGDEIRAGCWLIASADHPSALSTVPLCSQQFPLVSADGTRAVLVQAGRVRVVRVADNTTISRAALPALAPRSSNLELPETWETSTYYLVDVRYGTDLGLVRCSVTTGGCNIAVRSSVRGQIRDIVTERPLP